MSADIGMDIERKISAAGDALDRLTEAFPEIPLATNQKRYRSVLACLGYDFEISEIAIRDALY
jgi:hypothetical protein